MTNWNDLIKEICHSITTQEVHQVEEALTIYVSSPAITVVTKKITHPFNEKKNESAFLIALKNVILCIEYLPPMKFNYFFRIQHSKQEYQTDCK